MSDISDLVRNIMPTFVVGDDFCLIENIILCPFEVVTCIILVNISLFQYFKRAYCTDTLYNRV